jgi:thiol-disulfide isomerase/thioredoxin
MMLKAIGAENVARLRAMDPNRLRADAAAVFQRTMREFGDARPFETLATLGEQAAGALLRLNALEVGRPFPELGGIDLNGRPVKISDFRGKVVAISFWASWCGPCMGMVPDEKALVERMKGRPFVLVGVNGDNSVEDAKATAVKTGMNWRSLHGGGIGDGGIAVNLGISAWPTIFLLDGEGIIRDVSIALRGRELDGAVEGLVLEVEKGVKGR